MTVWRPTPGAADAARESVDGMRKAVWTAVRADEPWTAPFDAVVARLVQIARVDLCLARLVEGHADAMRILDQAGRSPQEGTYGVWASRSAGTGVRARPTWTGHRLTGPIRFASGVDLIDRALVPAWLDDGTHLLFDVPVADIVADRTSWRTAAMDASRSFTVDVDTNCDDDPVGPANFYLERPGFVIGGLGVAAVWVGGARAVVELVADGLRDFTPDAHQLRRLGAMQQAVWQATTVLDCTVARLGDFATADVAHEIGCARTAVVAACEEVVDQAGRIVGPAGLSHNARLARTLADLSIYLRQHHLDRALHGLGERALGEAEVVG